jgi:hypothetical protein
MFKKKRKIYIKRIKICKRAKKATKARKGVMGNFWHNIGEGKYHFQWGRRNMYG